MTKVSILGAGMAGLLAANMLRSNDVTVYEAQQSLPNNHSAVLRFRTSVVGDVLGVPFKSVQALRATDTLGNPIADALGYSFKATGKATLRSIARVSPVPVERYIAPPDLIPIMAKNLDINYGIEICGDDLAELYYMERSRIISTIPMPVMMKIVQWPKPPEFRFRKGHNVVCRLMNCEAYVSLYVPNPKLPFHRVSITGDELIIEYTGDVVKFLVDEDVSLAADLLGIPIQLVDPESVEVREQKYAKILPIDEDHRKKFIQYMTDEYNVYSLGRFACWRPGLLLDDVVHDVRSIQRMWKESTYDWRK